MTHNDELLNDPPADGIEAELAIARKIQCAMVPQQMPSIDGIDMASLFLPCGAVGGDLFDIIQLTDDTLVFIIFDVAGHGVASALISAMAKVSFSTHVRSVMSPRLVMERVNTEMKRNITADYFLTAFVGYLDLHNNKLTYCNAGHPYPMVFRKRQNDLVSLKTPGFIIGVFDNGFYEEESIYLFAGDRLFLFTDGIYEFFDEKSELLAQRRLEQMIVNTTTVFSPGAFLNQIKQSPGAANEHKLRDDVTAVIVEILTESRKNQLKERLGFKGDDPIYLQFISYYEEIDKVNAVILSAMDSLGYPDDSIRKMKISLTELLANAIYHGNKLDHSKKVVIGHLITKEQTQIAILDEGNGFDPALLPDPTLPENLIKDRGRGLYIVRNYVDAIDYNARGTRIKITKLHSVRQ